MEQSEAKVPWHLTLVAVLGVLWNAGGAFDYYMTQSRDPDYMAQFTEAQLEFFYGMPTLVVACWAIAVWGGVVGCFLLLLRRKIATPVLFVSWACMTFTAVRNYGFSDGMKVIGDPFSIAFSVVIFLIALALALYARSLTKIGALK